MGKDKVQEYKLTTAEAVAMIKRAPAGTRFAIHLAQDARVVDSDDQVFPGGLRTGLSVSRKDALKIASDWLHPALEERGGRMRLHVNTWVREWSKPMVTYWLG